VRALLATIALLTGCLNEGDEDMGAIETLGRWERLSKGQALGKRIVINVPPAAFGTQRPGAVDLLRINGRDEDACQIAITLIPPEGRMLAEFPGGAFPPDTQNISGYRTPASYIDSFPLPAGGYFAPPAVAIVRWGVGGVQSIAEVDFSSGAVVNVVASFVSVTAFVDLPAESFPEGVSVLLGAFVGPGFPKANNAQRSYNVQTLLPGAGSFPDVAYGANGYITPLAGRPPLFPIPPHAKQIWVLATDPNVVGDGTANTLDADIIFYRDTVTPLSKVGAFSVTNARPGPVPVPNGAVFWSIENRVGVSQNLMVTFDLTI